MSESKLFNAARTPETPMEASSLYLARLMRPEEVASATRDRPRYVKEHVAGSWMLCGDVNAQMFLMLRQASRLDFPTRLSAFQTSNGVGYGVITHQVNQHQHRFIFGLYDPPVRQFLEATTKDKFGFLLSNDGEDDALVIDSPFKRVEFMPLLAMSTEVSEEAQEVACLELPLVLSSLASPLQVPSIYRGQPVRQVSISLLLPSVFEKSVGGVTMKPTAS